VVFKTQAVLGTSSHLDDPIFIYKTRVCSLTKLGQQTELYLQHM